MSLETVLLAVGEDDEDQVDAIGGTAVDIAGPAGATVALAHVYTSEEYQTYRSQLDFDSDSEVTPDDVAKRHTPIRELGDLMSDNDIDFSWHGRLAGDDSTGERIVALAKELDADLVLVGGRNRSPAGKAVFGSTTQEVLLNAPCPVTFVRRE